MNTKAQASHDVSDAGQRSTADDSKYRFDSSKEKLLADLKLVAADVEKLITEATASSAEGLATLRTRFAGNLEEARAKIERTRVAVGEKARYATDATHAYVKENPWQSAAVFAAAGVIVGFFLGRRSAAFDVDVPIE